ncbi:MAG: tRNA dihydrouridine synthase DusB [Alphaproteobacteria bacterium]|nr:tRNA dihydrouridine synthase DusB [Alphaproteobacteria bacterium]
MTEVMLAPMAGVTDKPFRQMVRLFGNHKTYTEMIGVESLARNHPMTRKMMDIHDEKNVVVQLVGVNQKAMVYAAKMAQDMGAVGIDINMGCPVKKLISNGSGAALLKTPKIAADLVEQVKKSVDIPVSVKMRIGWDSEHINAVDFMKQLESAGVDSIAVHARTKAEGYSGLPHFDVVAEMKRQSRLPIIANGNVIDKTSAEAALAVTQADGIMIGRGALGKPWSLSEIETGILKPIDLEQMASQHFDLLLNYYGTHGVFIARKHLAWYAKGQKNVAEFCQKVYAETDCLKIRKIIHDFLRGKQ